MPSTARVSIAGRNNNNFVEASIDDVLNTQGGRSTVVDMAATVAQGFVWPPSGEASVYVRFPRGGAAYTIKLADTAGGTGFTFNVPIGIDPFPVIFGKPASGSMYVTPSIAVMATLYFF